jgi:hypothetical protein
MVRFHRYGLPFIFLLCCGLGLALGSVFGAGFAVLGATLGGIGAGAAAMFLDTPEKMENAVYGLLSVVFAVALVWLGLALLSDLA